jgi:hypothetical protein
MSPPRLFRDTSYRAAVAKSIGLPLAAIGIQL